MLKKLLIPCFVFAAAVAIGTNGCGSSSSGTGGGGKGGGSAGAKAGSGGSTAGSGGSTAGSGGGAAGSTDGGAAGAGAAGSDGGSAIPTCTSTMANSTPMSAANFCKIFLNECGMAHVGYTNETECEATYSALTASKPMRQQCQSYHLCNAVTMHDPTTHCPHAAGESNCTQNN
jgi:hypothetical protein